MLNKGRISLSGFSLGLRSQEGFNILHKILIFFSSWICLAMQRLREAQGGRPQRKHRTPNPACRAFAGLRGHGEPTAPWHMGLRERPVSQARMPLWLAPRAACGVSLPRGKGSNRAVLTPRDWESLKDSPQTPTNTAAPLTPSSQQLAEAPGQRSKKCGFRGINNTSSGPYSQRQRALSGRPRWNATSQFDENGKASNPSSTNSKWDNTRRATPRHRIINWLKREWKGKSWKQPERSARYSGAARDSAVLRGGPGSPPSAGHTFN